MVYDIEGYRAAPRWRARLAWYFAGLLTGWLFCEVLAVLRAGT